MAEKHMNLVLSFEVYKGDALVKTAEFREESITIGSGASAVLSIDDASLAELHAVVNVEPDGSVQLLDLGSDGGTRVDGKSIANAALSSGTAIELGDLRIIVSITDDAAFEDEEATHVMTTPAEAADDKTDPGGPRYDDEGIEISDHNTEDVMSFVLRAGGGQSNLGIDNKRPKVLEVNQMWGDMLLDTKHFRKATKAISIGTATGYRWSFVGIRLGWVPKPMAMVLPFTPPMWSETAPDWKNDFYCPDESLPTGREYTLFRWTGGQYVADIQGDWDGFADVGDKRYTFDELVDAGKATKSGDGYSVPLDEDVHLMIDIDGVVFYSHMVKPGRKVVTSFLDGIDFLFLGLLALSGFIALMFGLLIYFLPRPASLDMVEIDERFVELLLEMQEQEDKKDKKPNANPDAGEGAKAKREEGKVGKKDAKMDKAKGNKVEMQKQQMDKQIAENAGVLGALRDGGMMEGFGGAIDADMLGGIGGLIGAKGVQIGSGGLGSRGSGLGGGGTAEGLGGLGTKGIGSGASGYGRGGGHFGAKGEGGIGAVGGDPIILGALDRSLIDEVIKRHMNQIRYCYQRQLTKDPNLGGKVVIKFVIAKDGSVSSANKKSSSMKSPGVEQCIVSRFMRMQFPKPKGGGIVIVSYPFLFSAG